MLVFAIFACSPTEERPIETSTSFETPPPPTPPPPGDLVVSNPSGTLHKEFGTIVVVSWEQSATADTQVEFSFDDGVWLSSPVKTRTAGVHQELLLGIPYDTSVTWRVVATADGQTVSSPDL